MSMLLKKAQRHADAGPFLQPVSAEDVPDYYSIIIVSWSEWLARLGGVLLMRLQQVLVTCRGAERGGRARLFIPSPLSVGVNSLPHGAAGLSYRTPLLHTGPDGPWHHGAAPPVADM